MAGRRSSCSLAVCVVDDKDTSGELTAESEEKDDDGVQPYVGLHR